MNGKTMKASLTATLLICAWLARTCVAQTVVETGTPDAAMEKSYPRQVEEEETAQQRQTLQDEFMRVELAYMQVVKYYNKTLTDGKALEIARAILYNASTFELDPRLLVAVIAVESRFRPRALSPKGAMGLGQLMPGTARMLGVRNAYDVKENVRGTARYLRMQAEKWRLDNRNLDLTLASYNAGPRAVEKYNGIPPYRETRQYVKKVKKLYRFFIYGS